MQSWHSQTPESKAAAALSDSDTGLTTCRGICSNGRRCSRKPVVSPGTPRRSKPSLAAPDPPSSPFYCWQHQTQAGGLPETSSPDKSPSKPKTIRKQSSLDTLANRMGIMNITGNAKSGRQTSRSNYHERQRSSDEKVQRRRPVSKQSKNLSSGLCAAFFCAGIRNDENSDYRVVRYKHSVDREKASAISDVRNIPIPRPDSQPRIQSWIYHPCIPRSLDPKIQVDLRDELYNGKYHTEQLGYIYMYWIRSTSSPPVTSGGGDERSSSQLRRALQSSGPSKPKMILVKIGYTKNVYQRLVAWERQCGRDLELLRYYPHDGGTSVASSGVTTLLDQNANINSRGGGGSDGGSGPRSTAKSARNGSATPRMVPYSHKVERLIHIELAGRRADQGVCSGCGKEHKEWFYVDATWDGVKAVDGVIKKWVKWAEELWIARGGRR